jgi:MerR family transcriptional regulator/heat shock protein HspR
VTRSDAGDEPLYVISVVARLLGMHQQTLRYYERTGIITPSRSRGNVRLYSEQDVARLRQIKRLMDDLGVNLAGAEVILRMRDRLEQMEARIRELEDEVQRLREAAR